MTEAPRRELRELALSSGPVDRPLALRSALAARELARAATDLMTHKSELHAKFARAVREAIDRGEAKKVPAEVWRADDDETRGDAA